MAEIEAEIEIVLRVPGTLIYDHQGYIEWLDGNPADNGSLFKYILSDPDWHEGSTFPTASSDVHDVIECELVSVNGNRALGEVALESSDSGSAS